MYRRISALLLAGGLTIGCAAAALAASSPSVITGPARHIHQTSATLTATVNPNGSAASYRFEWGLTSSYGSASAAHSAGGGSAPVAVSTSAGGLIPGTAYHYTVVATNRYGTSSGADRTFKTAGPPPPGATTGPAANVTTSSALVSGVINPNGAVTGYRFDYGLDTSYPYQTLAGALPAGTTAQTVTAQLAGLASGTIFHYRLVAFHGSAAISYGPDAVFMTHPSTRPKPHISARTRPRHARHKPFTFTTTGTVSGPGSIPAVFDCYGFVAVRYLLGARSVAVLVVPVQPNCTYTAQATFSRLPGRGRRHRKVTLTVAVRFRGNGYLTPARARDQQVVLG
jgi:hypothetical protein